MKKTLIVFAALISQFAFAKPVILSAHRPTSQFDVLDDMEVKSVQIARGPTGWLVNIAAQAKEGQVLDFSVDFPSYADASGFAVDAAKENVERVNCKLESDKIAIDIQNPCHLDDIVVRSAVLP